MKLKSYPKYKESEIQWIGEIPEEWELERFRIRFKYQKGKIPENLDEVNGEGYLPYLSMDYLRGNSEEAYYSNDPKALKVKNGDLLLLWDGSNAGEFVKSKKGYLSSTMVKLSIEKMNNQYSWFLCTAFEPMLKDLTIGMGIPHVNGDTLGNIRIPIIGEASQQKISSFLDLKSTEINQTISKDKQLIKLLKEKKTALINHIVTKGLNPKVKMKDSGIDWIGEIPENWSTRRIDKLSTISRGASPRPIDDPVYFDDEGEYAWVRIADVSASSRYLEETAEKLSVLGKSLSVPLEPGRLFVSIAGTVGKPIITKIKCCIHDGFVYFKNLEVLNEYLYYIFIGGQAYLGLGKWGTQLNLNTETIGLIPIPLPSKQEQTQIVEHLDKATSKIDQTIKKIEEKINLMKEYKKSLIHHVVTGKVDVRNVVA